MENTPQQAGERPRPVFKAGSLLFSETILSSSGDTGTGVDNSPYLTGSN